MSEFRLTSIKMLEGEIVLDSGLHIGAGSDEIHIGGIDNPVIKHPHTGQPYIPGSSLKGRMRSLLEWSAGVVGQTNGKPVQVSDLARVEATQKKPLVEAILKLFGSSGDSSNDPAAERLGPSRLAFWDCPLTESWLQAVNERGLPFTEDKSENAIDRITGVALHPRHTERVPAGARFRFRLNLRQLHVEDAALLDIVLAGLKMVQLDGLGGGGSRGSGKLHFEALTLDGEPIQSRFDAIDPFAQVA